MELSKHAHTRQQQRGIAPIIIDLLLTYGDAEKSGDGTTKYFFTKRSRQLLRTYAGPLAGIIEEHTNCIAVLSSEGDVVTVAHRIKRIKQRK